MSALLALALQVGFVFSDTICNADRTWCSTALELVICEAPEPTITNGLAMAECTDREPLYCETAQTKFDQQDSSRSVDCLDNGDRVKFGGFEL